MVSYRTSNCAVKHCDKQGVARKPYRPDVLKLYCTDHKTRRSRRPRPSANCPRCYRDIDLISDGIEHDREPWHIVCYLKTYTPHATTTQYQTTTQAPARLSA